MTQMTWLHLSDWHQSGPDFNRQVIRDALLHDILSRTVVHPSLENIDFVVFSGDLAHRGLRSEYDTAREQFLDPILQAAGIGVNRLFIVPGNHDFDRVNALDMLPSELGQPLDSDVLVNKWLAPGRPLQRTLEPFEAYRDFITEYSGQPQPDYASVMRIDVSGLEVALLGLNSSWMTARNRSQNGQVDDDRHLILGEPQIHDALSQIADADCRIAVAHHPLEWLKTFDRDRVEGRLMEGVHFLLHGHEHRPKVTIVQSTSGDCVVIPAGASYDRRIPENPRYACSYNFVHLDLESRTGTVFIRRWSETRTAWIEDSDSIQGGSFGLERLPKSLGLSEKQKSTSVTLRISKRELEARDNAVEQRYRDMLLETCDIMNLANLPEEDRHIVQKQQELRLRGLYIPLRVNVEARPSRRRQRQRQNNELWDDVEQRRITGARSSMSGEPPRERSAIGERLSQSKRLIVLGDPGSGKTTLTRWLATAYLLKLKSDPNWKDLPDVSTLPDADWLPVIVRCRDLGTNHDSLETILRYTLRRAEFTEREGEILAPLLLARLTDGRAILILDGLDEIASPAGRMEFCQRIEQIAIAYPKAVIIATSRIVGYRELGFRLQRGFEHLTLADLLPNEKDDFARRWCSLTEVPGRKEEAANELIHDIHSTERIERLTGNPMLLTTMALVKRKIGKLPNRRADLYWEALLVLMNWRREVDEPLDWHEAVPQLEFLAYAMCERAVQQLRQDEVLELFSQMRVDFPNVHPAQNHTAEEFLRLLESRTGLLVEVGLVRHLGMEVPAYEFRHLTFQEYLAARALVDGRFPRRDPNKTLAECVAPLAGLTSRVWYGELGPGETGVVESWREALRLCVAICRDDEVDAVIQAILHTGPGEEKDVRRARAILAALCLADEPNVSNSVAESVLRAFASIVGPGDAGGATGSGVDLAAALLVGSRWEGTLRSVLLDHFLQHEDFDRVHVAALMADLIASGLPPDARRRRSMLTKWIRASRGSSQPEAIEATLGIMHFAFQGLSKLPAGLVDTLLSNLAANRHQAAVSAWALAWLNGGPGPTPRHEASWHASKADVAILREYIASPGADAMAVYFIGWILPRPRSRRPRKEPSAP